MERYNFSAGPAVLDKMVIDQLIENLKDFDHTGFSVAELSHRGKAIGKLLEETTQKFRTLLDIPDTYEILYLQGGASLQFHMIPLNFLTHYKKAVVVNTGRWTEKAISDIDYIGHSEVVGDINISDFKTKPDLTQLSEITDVDYGYYCANNTVVGTQFEETLPFSKNVPIVCDMSSCLLDKKIPIQDFDLIFAGAQKNLGVAGVTLVIVKKEFLDHANTDIPSMLSYKVHAKGKSLYNTPPVLAIASLNAVCDWALSLGGLDEISKRNREKAAILYEFLDQSTLYYNDVEKSFRSQMNVVFKLKDDTFNDEFVNFLEAQGITGIKGHRSVGGMRASIYNMMPLSGVKALINAMKTFEKNHQN